MAARKSTEAAAATAAAGRLETIMVEDNQDTGSGFWPTGVSDERRADILGRVAACDAMGVSTLAGVSSARALRLIVVQREREAGTSERKVLRTGDARRLKRDLLSIFAAEASSALAKESLHLLSPSLDRGRVQRRLDLYAKGRQAYDALTKLGKADEMRRILSRLAFAPSLVERRSLAHSDTLEFFIARRQMIEAIHALVTAFAGVDGVTQFEVEAADRKTLGEILRVVEEVVAGKEKDAEAVLSDAELTINDTLRRGTRSKERVLEIIDQTLGEIASALILNPEEEGSLRKAAMENLAIPFEFDRTEIRRLVSVWRRRKDEENAVKVRGIEVSLKQNVPLVNAAIEKALLLDQALAIASAAIKYTLTIPSIGNGGVGFLDARNFFLVREELVGGKKSSFPQPISYALGKTAGMKKLAKPRNTAILTGANSGGKTTLLNTVASVHILTLLGLPIPAGNAEVTPMPIYLFRKRMARRSGSLEHVLKSLIPILADRQRKLVLIDELEALTEPGAAGRIIASIINHAAATSSLFLLVTHLAKETLPYVKLPVRIDGIEASGLDEKGELIVDRQPVFDHIGSSTPKLIVMKLAKASKKDAVKAIYNDVLVSLEGEGHSTIQAPMAFPWADETG